MLLYKFKSKAQKRLSDQQEGNSRVAGAKGKQGPKKHRKA